MNAVFVYQDGQVGLRDIPSGLETFRQVLKPARLSALVSGFDPSQDISLPIEEFHRKGRTFDGRPIYVTKGFDIYEAAQIMLVTRRDWDLLAKDQLAHLVRQFVKREHPDAIFLDEWAGEVPFTLSELHDGLDKQHIRKLGHRLLVADGPVRVSFRLSQSGPGDASERF